MPKKTAVMAEEFDNSYTPFFAATVRIDALPSELAETIVEATKAAKKAKKIPVIRLLAGGGDYLLIKRKDICEKKLFFSQFSVFQSFLVRFLDIKWK